MKDVSDKFNVTGLWEEVVFSVAVVPKEERVDGDWFPPPGSDAGTLVAESDRGGAGGRSVVTGKTSGLEN